MRLRNIAAGITVGVGACLLFPGAACAQSQGQSAASTWYDSYGRSSTDRSVSLQAAELQQRARNGGFGPAVSNTTVEGDVISNTTNNGPVNSSTAYSSVNSATTTTSVSGSSGITVVATTGQTSGTATQTTTSGAKTGTANTNVSCGGTGACK